MADARRPKDQRLKHTDVVETEGAKIVFDVRGAGDPVLMIPGAGGDASVYDQVATLLSDRYTVITYDRRCNARSSGDADRMLDMAQQARDAVAVIRAAGFERATVFGNSGGGNIALQLAASHANAVSGLVLHAPPVVTLLKGKDSGDGRERLKHKGHEAALPLRDLCDLCGSIFFQSATAPPTRLRTMLRRASCGHPGRRSFLAKTARTGCAPRKAGR